MPALETNDIIGTSPRLSHCLGRADAVADTDATVLVLGESGVGKDLLARRIHGMSRRAGSSFVAVNCAAIPRDLFESEFFGHVKGAFSGATQDRKGRLETAQGGTLFLDEIGETPPELQGKLLRALQNMSFERVGDDRTRHVDVRVIAATNRSLADDTFAGRFRRDLYYRISAFPIEMPALRERPEDIPALAEHFLTESSTRLRRRRARLAPEQISRLQTHDWPGNIRELKNVIERAVIIGAPYDFDGILPPASRSIPHAPEREPSLTAPGIGFLTATEFAAFERSNLIAALEQAHWRVSGPGGAAELLGMKPSTLSSRLKALAIERPAPGSLFARLGGQGRIAAFARDLLGRMQADPQVGRHWADRSPVGIHREEKLLVQYLCSALGGPITYTGRSMVHAHVHLKITKSDWSVFLQHLEATFDALGLDTGLRRDLVNTVETLRADVVTA